MSMTPNETGRSRHRLRWPKMLLKRNSWICLFCQHPRRIINLPLKRGGLTVSFRPQSSTQVRGTQRTVPANEAQYRQRYPRVPPAIDFRSLKIFL